MRGTILRGVVVLLCLGVIAGTLYAADGGLFKDPVPSAAKDKPKADSGKAPTKDPVAAAFALPKHLKYDNLRADQKTKYDALKRDKEPKLRDALARVESASSEPEKTKAAREVAEIRKDIKAEINAILNTPDPAAVKAMQDAMKNAASHGGRAGGGGHASGGGNRH